MRWGIVEVCHDVLQDGLRIAQDFVGSKADHAIGAWVQCFGAPDIGPDFLGIPSIVGLDHELACQD